MMGTVNDFRNLVFSRAGVADYTDFINRSARHIEFWGKLNSIGARRIRELHLETVSNIDATVVLSEEEWKALEKEMEELL